MMTRRTTAMICVACLLLIGDLSAAQQEGHARTTESPYAAWPNGPPKDASFFPIAVWLQSPRNAARYRAIGVNTYVGLWQGPTAEQIDELKRNGMLAICGQNEYALAHLDEKTIVGWMHGDEPDNAQSLAQGEGYGPPILPQEIVEDYQRVRRKDPSRPVLLNLGQGVAWDDYIGRGVRRNHPEDYPQYVQGADIVSFDIYPAVHRSPAVAGKLWYVARGVQRLQQWTERQKVVWNCIECTHISNTQVKPTAEQVKAEVWMSIIHGSRGIVYFCHQFQPQSIEAGLLADAPMSQAVSAINQQIHRLATVINSPAVDSGVTATADPGDVEADHAAALRSGPIALMAKRHADALYVFSVRMEARPAKAVFRVPGLPKGTRVEVIDEQRTVEADDGQFADTFAPWEVHLYRIGNAEQRNVVVYREPGRYGGWPANHGIWSWGDEIVVGFTVAWYKPVEEGHAVDRSKPSEEWQLMRTGARTAARSGSLSAKRRRISAAAIRPAWCCFATADCP